jgi:hydroxymethylbilane synthase
MTQRIRIGTRGSKLALWQANAVAGKLAELGCNTVVVPISTTGDRRTDVSLAEIGGKGVFIKELEEALARREIDLAVHSLKDVPSIMPPQFALAGFLPRADPRDAWVQQDGKAIDDLPEGSVVATGAPRRRAQILARWPHLRVEPIRGNVDTRLRKLRDGSYGGGVLAAAGLLRLGLADGITSFFDVDVMTPAAGQGIVALETLHDDDFARETAARINDSSADVEARCERGVLARFGTLLNCNSAIAVNARFEQETTTIRAFAGDGARSIRLMHVARDPNEAIEAVFAELVRQGARDILRRADGQRAHS